MVASASSPVQVSLMLPEHRWFLIPLVFMEVSWVQGMLTKGHKVQKTWFLPQRSLIQHEGKEISTNDF